MKTVLNSLVITKSRYEHLLLFRKKNHFPTIYNGLILNIGPTYAFFKDLRYKHNLQTMINYIHYTTYSNSFGIKL